MPTIINGTTGIDKVQDGTITSADLASGAALANIGANGVTAGYLDTQSQYTGFKNRIINGAMMIDQRNAGAAVTQTASGGIFGCDRWNIYGTVTSKFSAQQVSTAPTGFVNSTKILSLSAYSSGSSEQFIFRQLIEGYNVADLNWGSANAKAITISFWVQSSLTGTFGGSVLNSDASRCYPFSFTISAANTWEQKSVTIAGDTTGTWLTTNGIGLNLTFNMGSGSSLLGTAGVWGSTYYTGVTGNQSVVGTNGATFYITGVQLEKGSTATSFDYRPYGTELALCQRYYQVWAVTSRGFAGTATDYIAGASLCVQMRATPTVAIITNASSHSTVVGAYSANNVWANSSVASNNQYLTQLIGSANAEL